MVPYLVTELFRLLTYLIWSYQCGGSGSALIWLSWIRIRIAKADPNPGARKLTKIKKLTWFPLFKMGFYLRMVPMYVLWNIMYILLVPISCDGKVWERLPGSGSALREKAECGSLSASKPMQIRNTGPYFLYLHDTCLPEHLTKMNKLVAFFLLDNRKQCYGWLLCILLLLFLVPLTS
jgi:hypothetical protein